MTKPTTTPFNALVSLANVAASTVEYSTWNDRFCRDQLKTVLLATTKAFENVPFETLSKDELQAYGFSHWEIEVSYTNDNGVQHRYPEGIMLIPIWLKNAVNPEATVISINNRVTTAGEMDNDTRGGMLGYGFPVGPVVISDPRKQLINLVGSLLANNTIGAVGEVNADRALCFGCGNVQRGQGIATRERLPLNAIEHETDCPLVDLKKLWNQIDTAGKKD